MSKLRYEMNSEGVKVIEFVGENWSDEGKEIKSESVFSVADVPAVLADGDGEKSLAAYGLLKLLQDRTSQEDGGEAKVEAMHAYYSEYFVKGLWRKPAERKATAGGGSRRKIGASLAEAIARLQGCTAIQAESALKDLSKEQFEGLVKNPKVVEMVKEVEDEATGGVVDLTDL